MGVDAPTYSTYIVAENHRLAVPIIERYSLRRSDDVGRFRAFAGETILLAESRGDALRAAALVGLLLGRHGHDEHTRLFHLGCGWRQSEGARELEGELVLVNRVVDASSGRSFLPDILLRHELREAAVETRTNAGPGGAGGAGAPAVGVTDTPTGEAATGRPHDSEHQAARPALCDRELAGVFAAALTLLSPHQLYGLVAVEPRAADGGETDTAAQIIGCALPAFERLIEASAELFRPVRPRIDPAVLALLEEIVEHLRLTTTQRSQLARLAEAASARGEDLSAGLKQWCEGPQPTSKQEQRKRFDELKRSLSG